MTFYHKKDKNIGHKSFNNFDNAFIFSKRNKRWLYLQKK